MQAAVCATPRQRSQVTSVDGEAANHYTSDVSNKVVFVTLVITFRKNEYVYRNNKRNRNVNS